MRTHVVGQANGTPRQRSPQPDAFDPVRRGPVSRPGQRGQVLTRRQRQARDEPARLTCLAEEHRAHEASRWLAEVAAQGRIHEFAPRHAETSSAALRGWPLPLNRMGAVADSAVRLWTGVSRDPVSRLPTHDTPDRVPARSARQVALDPMPASAAASAASADPALEDPAGAQGARAATNAFATGERLSMGETVVLGWLRQGCGAMMEIGRRLRGVNWTTMHTTIASYALPRCSVILNRDGNAVSRQALAMSGEAGREFRLIHQVPPPRVDPGAVWLTPLAAQEPVPDLAGSADATLAGDEARVTGSSEVMSHAALPQAEERSLARSGRTGRMVILRSPFEYMAVNTVRLNFPKEDRVALVEGGKQVAAKLDEFLQAPCQTMSQTVAEASNTPVGTGERVGTALCDFVYNFTPFGAILSPIGQAIGAVSDLVHPRNVSEVEMRRTLEMLTFSLKPNSIVMAGGRPTLWDGHALQEFEATEPDHGLLVDNSPARPDVLRMPGVPVELGEQGWQISEVPQAYRVVSLDDTFAADPDKIEQTSPRHGHLRIDGALYEVHRDPTTTRWRIVPPDDAQGVAIAVEHVVEKRRWQAVTLLGAGDPPPLFEQYDVRDATLRGGPEGDVYSDAHGEEYNEDLLPAGVVDRSVDQLMSDFVDSTRSPRELGVLHRYIEARRDEEMTAQLLSQVRQRLVTLEDQGRYGQGALRYDWVEIPGFVHGMSRRQLLQLGLGGDLDTRQLGALVGHLIHEGLVVRVQLAANRMMLGATRVETGALRWDRIQLPGVGDDAPYETLAAHLFYSPRFTDTQRGALMRRMSSAAEPVRQELLALTSRVALLRRTAQVEFEYGFDNTAAIPLAALDAETTVLGTIRAISRLPNPTLTGAAWARLQPRLPSIDNLAVEATEFVSSKQFVQQDFVAGFSNALEVELPGTAGYTSMQLALEFDNPDRIPLQRGALFKQLLDQLLMENIEWQLRGYMARDNTGDMARGFANPYPDSVPGLPYPAKLEDITTRLARTETTLEQAGMLQYFAQEAISDLRVARVEAIRHRMITGTQLADYLEGYLNPPAEEADFLRAIGEPASIDSLYDLFINQAGSARRRGELAYYMARFDNVGEAAAFTETVLARVFAGAQATHRIPFAQTSIPPMLMGLVGGGCFAFALIVSVAMRHGPESTQVIVIRTRAFESIRSLSGEVRQSPVPHTLSLESRNFLSALASLALRQPGSSGELVAGEMVRIASQVELRNVASIVYEAALREGHEDHVILTSSHAMALRVAVDGGDPRTVSNFLFYEPNYGLLEFDRYDRFDHSLRIISEAAYYRREMLGGNPHVDVYRVNVDVLERVRVCGHLRVRDIIRDRPFVRARDRVRVEGESRSIHGRQGEDSETRGGGVGVDAGVQAMAETVDTGAQAVAGSAHADAQAGAGLVDAGPRTAGTQTDEAGAMENGIPGRVDAGTQTDVDNGPQA